MLIEAYGESALSQKDANDEPRSGRPNKSTTDENVEKVQKIVLVIYTNSVGNRRITIREVTDDVGMSFGSCQTILVMKGRRFATIEEIKTASLEELKVIPKSAHQKCLGDQKKRWHECIISEGDNINIDE